MKNSRLLLVDDDGVALATFGKGLRDAGYSVNLAHSGEEALQLVTVEVPDLVILDMRMPGLSGIETAKRLGDLDIPVIFISAYNEEESVQGAVKEGALGYLVKPIDVSHAIPTIESALQRAYEFNDLRHTKNRLNNALETGNIVNVVVGMLMERHQLERKDAYELLRQKARSEQRKVKDVAEEWMTAWNTINQLTQK
jgi:AmiR/NasT family two-component response regulator